MKNKLSHLILVGKSAYIIGTLFVFNFLFGWIFLGFFYWLLVGMVLFLLLVVSLIVGKNLIFKPLKERKREEVIDIEAEVLPNDMAQIETNTGQWQDPVYCPFCNSKNTRFIEPHYEASIYECNICQRRFETEE